MIDFDFLWETKSFWSYYNTTFEMRECARWFFWLTDDNIQNVDVIAIQELWRNFFVSITLNVSQSDFHLLYKLDEDTRIYFYVNDKLNTNN